MYFDKKHLTTIVELLVMNSVDFHCHKDLIAIVFIVKKTSAFTP